MINIKVVAVGCLGILLGFAIGFWGHFTFFGPLNTRYHWRVVESYYAYVNDPANYRPDATTGLSEIELPADPAPSLAALVNAGELSHMDVVLPTVPNSGNAARYWRTFCQSHKEIVFATGNPSYTAFTPAGTQPVHLNLWFRDADQHTVQTLLRELEEHFAN